MPGAGKAGKFNKIYAKENTAGEIIEWKVVECKGGTSPLKGRNGNGYNQQGTKEYIQSIVDDLINKDALSSQQKRLLDNLNEALRDGKVKSFVCRQPFDEATGALKTPQIQQVQF